MKTKLNLLIALCMSFGMEAQNQKTMENKIDSTTQGQVIKKGKLIYSEIIIKASPEKVWQEFTNFDSYSKWNPFIKSLKGSPAPENKIEVFLQPPGKKGMLFKPKVLVFEPLHQFRWIGKLFIGGLFDGEHTFLIRDNKDGTTTFVQFERFKGVLIPFMKKMLDGNTLNGFNQMNKALKLRCEIQIQ
jgi:hypothetical protein